MGQEQSQLLKNNNNLNNQYQTDIFSKINLSKSLFEFLYVIGRGGFGKVWKVNLKRTQKCYALKEMSKLKIILRRSEKSIQSERELLSNLYHPFLVNMICAFQDYENLYLVMDLFKGGDLRYHIFLNKKFTENQSKFFCANVILGLEYIHNNNIIHRDIKPENLVLDSNGYLAITDFGVAKKYTKNNSSETSGTPGYMAPEVLCSLNHSFYVDFYAIGVMAYEFMNGHRPYIGRNRKEIKEAVLAKQVIVTKKDLKENSWSIEAADFINRMLQRKVIKRLGYNGINEIKKHFWFKNINWNELLRKKLKSPFIPKEGDNFDKKFCESSDNFFEMEKDLKDKYEFFVKKKEFRNLFWNYTYIREEEKKEVIQNYFIENRMIDNQFRNSYIKIVQGNKKYPLRINNYMSNNNNINDKKEKVNNENKNTLNKSKINYNIKQGNNMNSSKSYNNIFISPGGNRQVFQKKRASKNSMILDKNPINYIKNNFENNSYNYRNSVIIINPFYNQNINYFSGSDIYHNEPFSSKNIKKNNFIQENYSFHGKTKSFDNFLKNFEEKNILNDEKNKTIVIKNKKDKIKSDLLSYKKNIPSYLQPSSSLKAIRKNIELIKKNHHLENNNNIEKERIVYSPPHVISAKINLKNNSKNKLISSKVGNNDINSKKNITTRNNEHVKSLNYLYENNNFINNKIKRENYCTLDYTLNKNKKTSSISPSFNYRNFKSNNNETKNRNYEDQTKTDKLFIRHINNKSSININDNNFNYNDNEKNSNILYSTLNKFFYKRNNSTISYSYYDSNKNIKKEKKRPSYLYNNSKIMKEKLFNNPNFGNYSFTIKNKENNSSRIEHIFKNINITNNHINHKQKNDINKAKQLLNNKNNFNKKKTLRNKNDKYSNLNILKKNNNKIDLKLWSTSENNKEKINNNFENTFPSTIKNNKENINNNFLTNINSLENNKNEEQVKRGIINISQLKKEKNN